MHRMQGTYDNKLVASGAARPSAAQRISPTRRVRAFGAVAQPTLVLARMEDCTGRLARRSLHSSAASQPRSGSLGPHDATVESFVRPPPRCSKAKPRTLSFCKDSEAPHPNPPDPCPSPAKESFGPQPPQTCTTMHFDCLRYLQQPKDAKSVGRIGKDSLLATENRKHNCNFCLSSRRTLRALRRQSVESSSASGRWAYGRVHSPDLLVRKLPTESK